MALGTAYDLDIPAQLVFLSQLVFEFVQGISDANNFLFYDNTMQLLMFYAYSYQ